MLTGLDLLVTGARARARDKYGAFDQVNAELHQLRERCDAFDVLADALRTPDGWLSYRVSVRNVVPTLTSSKRRGLSLNG
jgi:hypothetical protein